MLLRSSSTPVIGSLLSSFSAESPNNHFEPKPTSIHHTPTKFSFHQTGSLNISHNSSPISPFIDFDRYSSTGFIRRAQSDGNLEGLAYAASCDRHEDDAASCDRHEDDAASCDRHEDDSFFCDSYQPIKACGRFRGTTLQTIPSFSLYKSGALGEDDEDTDMENDEEEEEEVEENERMGGDNFVFEEKVKSMSLSEDMRTMGKMWSGGFEEPREQVGQEMHLAWGLGICGGGGGGRSGREANWEGAGGDGGDNNHGVEEQYKKMVEEHPGNPLFLGNYARFLYQTKRDLPLAEEYYSRSILADPNDGEILAQYAKVVWELHHDQDRALRYYERAVQAAPQDSHVHAAYASFLWETEEDYEDENEADVGKDLGAMPPYIHGGIMTSASA